MKTILFAVLTFAAGLAAVPIQTARGADEGGRGGDVTLRVTPERGLVYSGGSRELVVQVEVEGKRGEAAARAPMNVALVLDRSGSMQGAKIEKARQAACLALDQLADDDYFSLVIFDDRTELLIPPTRVGSGGHREELKSRIDRIRPGGSTAIYAGVKLGAEQVRRHLEKECVNRIILMSDGIANVGPSRTSDLAGLGRELREDGLSVTTIGLGDDYNEDLMTALAESSNANYYYVRDAEKLPGIFTEELHSSRSVVAHDLMIRIKAGRGVRLEEIIGRPEIECHGGTAEIKLPEFFGGDRRRFLARCVIDAASEEAIDAASVDLEYTAPGGARAEAQRQAARVGFTGDQVKSDESVRVEVARDVSITRNRLAKDLAVKLADEGRTAEAVSVLRSQATSNIAAAAPVRIPKLEEENRALEETAKSLEKGKSLAPATRKQIQYENWQDKYQKR